jgi:hypothetical protein
MIIVIELFGVFISANKLLAPRIIYAWLYCNLIAIRAFKVSCIDCIDCISKNQKLLNDILKP